MKHELKTWPEYFQPAWAGVKPFEIRRNDRNFALHDEIVLQEYDPKEDDYTGREIAGFITYLIVGNGFVPEGFAAFAYREIGRTE